MIPFEETSNIISINELSISTLNKKKKVCEKSCRIGPIAEKGELVTVIG